MFGNQLFGRPIRIIKIVAGEMKSSDSAAPVVPTTAVKKEGT